MLNTIKGAVTNRIMPSLHREWTKIRTGRLHLLAHLHFDPVAVFKGERVAQADIRGDLDDVLSPTFALGGCGRG